MTSPSPYPYQLRLPLAPYRFVWRGDAAVEAEKDATESYTQERYTHADGTSTIIREYRADGSFLIMSDRGEIGSSTLSLTVSDFDLEARVTVTAHCHPV